MRTLTVTQRVEFQAFTDDDYDWLKADAALAYGESYTVTNDDANRTVVIERVSEEVAP